MTQGKERALDSRQLALIAAEAASDKKAEDIVAVEVANLLVVTDYFVIGTGQNDRQVRAIADEVEDQLREKAGVKPIGREGTEEGKWVLLDFADIVVHIFQPDERDFYRLERLWGEAPRLALPQSVTGYAPETPAEEPAPVDSDADADSHTDAAE